MESIQNDQLATGISPSIQSHVMLLLNQVTPFLRSRALKLTRNSNDAKDLFQETAMRIISKADKYKQGSNFKAWAVTIMRNTFINNYRKKIRMETVLDATPENYYLNLGSPRVENNGLTNMAYDDLVLMVSALPENLKRSFWMAYKGYSYVEIARTLDAPIGTIKSRIHLARRRLQNMYEHSVDRKRRSRS